MVPREEEDEVRSLSETESAVASHCGERERDSTEEPERIHEALIRKVDFPPQCMLERSLV